MSSETSTQLHGYKLILARAAWVVITAMAIVLWIADIPPGYVQNLTVCTLATCPNQLPTPELVQSLHSAGLSLQFYAIYVTALSVLFMLVFFVFM